MVKTTYLLAAVLAPILFLSGCSAGLLYKHTTRPLDLNLGDTKVVETSNKGHVQYLQYYVQPLQFTVSASWDSNAIGDIAKKNGMETIYYADLEVLSVLSFWNRFTVHVYGE